MAGGDRGSTDYGGAIGARCLGGSVYKNILAFGEAGGEVSEGGAGGGIRLTFDLSSTLHGFGAWREREHQLNLSGEYFCNSASLSALSIAMVGCERAGENPRGCNTPEYVVSHEFAHCLLRRLDILRYDAWWRSEDPRQICSNALGNSSEGFADGLAMILHKQASAWPPSVRALYEMLRKDGVMS